MPENLEARLLEAFVALVESVLVQERIGYYETTYWFDDETPLQVIEFNVERAEEEGETDTYDYSFQLQNDRFDISMIGFFSGEWSYQLEPYQNPDQFLAWLGEHHVVVRMSGTD